MPAPSTFLCVRCVPRADSREVSMISVLCWSGSGSRREPLVTILHSYVSSGPLQPYGNHFYSLCLIKMSHPL